MLIDYLSFSLNFEGIDLDYVLHLLMLEEYAEYFEDIGKRSRYEHCYKFGNINILLPYSSRPDMGILVTLTGQGCREFEQLHTNLFHREFNWGKFMERFNREINLSHKVNITRLDIAFDDFIGLLQMDVIEKKLLAGEYVSRFKKWDNVEAHETHSKKGSLGKTVYVGSRSSSCYCKFYDKMAEQMRACRLDEDAMKKLGKLTHWVRFEVTFKDKVAIQACNTLCFSLEPEREVAEMVNRYFRFVEPDDKNVSRCSVSKFWIEFIGTEKRSRNKVVSSDWIGYNKTYLWFKQALAPTLFALMRTYKNLDGFINDIWQYGSSRLKEHHKLLMNCKTMGQRLSNEELWDLNNPYYNQVVNFMNGGWVKEMDAYKPFHYSVEGVS